MTVYTVQKPSRALKRLLIIGLCICLFISAVLGVLQIGALCSARRWTYWSPDYEKQDITHLLEKESLTDKEYQTLYRQTGLTRLAVDDLIADGQAERIVDVQNFFFQKRRIQSERFHPFTYIDQTDDFAPIAKLRDGDIIVSASVYVSWWRYGHCAMVVDGDRGLLIECYAPGEKSAFAHTSTFTDLACFMILRPKASEQTKSQVAEYAKERLMNIPYRLTTGIFSKKYSKTLTGTQCAHIVWYAYKTFGIDLDSTGGAVVKPRDIANAEQVELVQAYGFNLQKLWG